MSPSANPDSNNRRLTRGRVLLVTPQPFYEDRGTPISLRYVLRGLSELGYQVDVLAFPLGRPIEVPRTRIYRTPNPFRFRSVPIGLSWKKIVLDIFQFFELRKRLSETHYDWIHAVEEAVFTAAILRRPGRNGLIYDMASSLPEHLALQFPFGHPVARSVLRRLERWVVRRTDRVVCSAGLLEHVRTIVPKHPATEWWFPASRKTVSNAEVARLRRDLGIGEDDTVLLYTGNFSRYQGVPTLLSAIGPVVTRVPDTLFVLVGASASQAAAIQRRIDPAIKPNLRILERQPWERMRAFLALADFLISPRVHGNNAPLKIFEYLASGTPILASDISAHRAVLDESRAVFFEPTSRGIAQAVLQVLSDPASAAALGVAARRHAEEQLTWPKFVALLDRIYSEDAVAATAPANPRMANR